MVKMKLAPIFSSHAVFQANKPIRIFGNGEGCAEIIFDGEKKTANSEDGAWQVSFDPRPYGGPYTLTATLNGEKTVLTDIYVGEVLLLAGQSNIAMKLDKTSFPVEQIKENLAVRYFAARRFENEDETSPEDGWVLCEKERAGRFSAIGYHVGMELSEGRGVAVGLIACYLGASVIESWMPRGITDCEQFYLPPEEKYSSPYAKGPHNEKGMLYSVRFKSIVPFSVGGVIWYQGESNTGPSEHKIYTRLLAELITCWRGDLMDSKLPCYVVQIADRDARDDEAWHGIQAAQAKIVELLSDVYVIKSADVCESFDIHPPTKIKLAKRIYENLRIK